MIDFPIIDMHTHLGDVLEPNGGDIVEQGELKKQVMIDPLNLFEQRLWRGLRIPKSAYQQITRASAARSATATRANLRRSMDEHGVVKSVVLSVPPNVTFTQVYAAHLQDPNMLPFTGVDFHKLDEVEVQLYEDVLAGAMGLKLHPILQQVSLDSDETRRVVETFAQYNRPIIFHAGVSEYYLEPEKQHLQTPEFGHIEDATRLIKDFPNVKFIVGHAGLDGVDAVMQQMGHLDNVWVDISFQNEARVAQLIETFGPERVMFGSDWPWGNMWVSIKIIEQVAKGDVGLMRRMLHDNAEELLQLSSYDLTPLIGMESNKAVYI